MVSKAMIDGMYIIRLVISNPEITTSPLTILSKRSSASEKKSTNCHTNEEARLSYALFAQSMETSEPVRTALYGNT